MHDLDGDKQLDGLELLAAMNHVMGHENDIPAGELEKSPDLRQSLQNWWNEKFEEDARKYSNSLVNGLKARAQSSSVIG